MVPRSTTHFSSPLFFQPVRSFPLKREIHPPFGGAFATTATPRNTAAATKAPILFTVKSPSLLTEKSQGLAGRNLSQIQRSLRLFPSITLSFRECLACIPSARWFPPLQDRGCTASSDPCHRTDKFASREDRSHRLHTPPRPYLPRHPSRKWPPDSPFERAREIHPTRAHNSHS